MKTIEKTTRDGDTQIFEVIESRKELQSFLRDLFWDSLYSQYKTGIWEDGDTSVDFYDKDGNYTGYREGDQVNWYHSYIRRCSHSLQRPLWRLGSGILIHSQPGHKPARKER